MTKYVPKPGDIGLSSSDSLIGRFVRLGQAVVGDHSFVSHAFIVLHDGQIVEAMPGGAKFASLDKYPEVVFSKYELTLEQRDAICEAAIRMEGTPYSFLDYLALFLTHLSKRSWVPLRWSWLPRVVRRRVTSSGHMICSQLCAEAYRQAGLDLTGGAEEPQDLTPGDLARYILKYNGGPLDAV